MSVQIYVDKIHLSQCTIKHFFTADRAPDLPFTRCQPNLKSVSSASYHHQQKNKKRNTVWKNIGSRDWELVIKGTQSKDILVFPLSPVFRSVNAKHLRYHVSHVDICHNEKCKVDEPLINRQQLCDTLSNGPKSLRNVSMFLPMQSMNSISRIKPF